MSAADAQPDKKSNAAKRDQGKAFVPKPIEPLLSRDELRACMARQKHNKEQADKVTRLQSEVQAEKQELQRGGEAMKAELASLDRSNAEAVKAYNDRSAARNQRIAEFEKRIDEFNASVNAFDEGRAVYGRDCENRKFDEKDEKALLQES